MAESKKIEQVLFDQGVEGVDPEAVRKVKLRSGVMMPVAAHNLLFAMGIIGNAATVLAERCVAGIEADAAMCAHWLERSPAIVTALAPRIGYAEAAKLAKEALAKNETVRQLVEEKGLLKPGEIDEVLDYRAMTEPGVPGEGMGGG